MVLFHFRVHIDNLEVDKLVGFIKSSSVVILIVRELGERPHIHCILTPTKTASTFRQQFLKTFPMCKGNKCYSFEEVKEEENMKLYLCKGDSVDVSPVVIYSTFDTDLYHIQYWDNNAKLKKDSNVKVKDKSITWIKEVKRDFLIEYPFDARDLSDPIECQWKPDDITVNNYIKSKKVLLGFILKRLGKSVKVLDDNIVTRLFKGILNSFIQDGEHCDAYTEFMYSKLAI